MAGRLPAPERAAREELERAEKTHKRLVAWRWLSLRFEAAYPDRAAAEAETVRLDTWIEEVLSTQRQGKEGGPMLIAAPRRNAGRGGPPKGPPRNAAGDGAGRPSFRDAPPRDGRGGGEDASRQDRGGPRGGKPRRGGRGGNKRSGGRSAGR